MSGVVESRVGGQGQRERPEAGSAAAFDGWEGDCRGRDGGDSVCQV